MEDMDYSLEIKGFKNKAEVIEFFNWYEGQGEQDASIWFEERKNEGKIDISNVYVDMEKSHPLKFNKNKLNIFIKRY